jgi:hypothetical protein
MPRHFLFCCHPWDLDDEGFEPSISRLAGHVGVDGITVTAVSDEVAQFRPRRIGPRRSVSLPAAANFQPDAAFYKGTRIRPITAVWMKSRNPLEKIAAEANRFRLELRARVHCFRNVPLVERYPMTATVNLFGEPSDTTLCPSNPDVRAYMLALVEDLATNFPLSAIELDHFGFENGAILARRWRHGAVLPLFAAQLLSLCFCPACRERAAEMHVDADAAMATAGEAFNQCFESPEQSASDVVARLDRDENLLACGRARARTIVSLLHDIRRRARVGLVLNVDEALTTDAWTCGLHLSDLEDACDGFVFMPSEASQTGPTPEQPASLVSQIARDNAHHLKQLSNRTHIRIRSHPPASPDGPALVRATLEALQAGHSSVSYDHYGATPEPALEWVRQAIRYTRREEA